MIEKIYPASISTFLELIFWDLYTDKFVLEQNMLQKVKSLALWVCSVMGSWNFMFLWKLMLYLWLTVNSRLLGCNVSRHLWINTFLFLCLKRREMGEMIMLMMMILLLIRQTKFKCFVNILCPAQWSLKWCRDGWEKGHHHLLHCAYKHSLSLASLSSSPLLYR